MGYEVAHTEGIPITDLSEVDEIPPDLNIRDLTEALDLDSLRAKLWYLSPGEEIGYHAHAEQEEFYYVIEGDFSLKLGESGDTEIVEAGPGTFFVAKPGIGHGYRNVGDDRGVVLAIGAPSVEDPGLDPHSLEDE